MKHMDRKKIFMIGMPSSGKTSYLAALVRLLDSGQSAEWKMDVRDIPKGLENIRNMIKNLDSYQIVGRTQGIDLYDVELNLYNPNKEYRQFIVPDTSGEIYRDLVYDRWIPSKIMEQIVKSDRLLFFINVNTMISEKRMKLGETSAIKLLDKEHGNAETKNTENKEEDTKKYNDQSALVELLQNIIYLVPLSLHIRFVISAWDLVEKEYGTDKLLPVEYIRRKLPLLYQYLISNSKKIHYDIWGVSAQGGDFDNKDDLEKLQNDSSDDGVYIIDSRGGRSKDLTRLL